jgi:hypothetical protein
MAEFYQVQKIKDKDGKEVIDLDQLNFTLRRSFDLHKHVDESGDVHGITGEVMGADMDNVPGEGFKLLCASTGRLGGRKGSHATEWPTVDDIDDGEWMLWNNEATGWRLYIRVDTVMLYVAMSA